jgi:hypothetical protein
LAVGMIERERERERETKREGGRNREEADFLLTLDPIFVLLRPWNPPLFIGGRRRHSCLYQDKIAALDSVEKDPNHWFKVCI